MNRKDAKAAKLGREERERAEIEGVATSVVDSAITVHKALGPGLLESVYQKCLAHELKLPGLHVECEVPRDVRYRGEVINLGYRMDMVVEDLIVIENKTVENLLPIHAAQLLTYLKLNDIRLGFLLDWNVSLMKDGIHRFVNGL